MTTMMKPFRIAEFLSLFIICSGDGVAEEGEEKMRGGMDERWGN